MLQVTQYDWQDAEEPTAEQLAEIDAAIDAAQPISTEQFTDAWLASYPVKKALDAVGLPDGSAEWLIAFTSELFAQTEAVAPYRDTAHRVFELATQWHHALGRRGWTKRGHMPLHLLREMVELMPIEAVARYLSASEAMGAGTAPSVLEGPRTPTAAAFGCRHHRWLIEGSDDRRDGAVKILARERMDVQKIERLLFPLLDLDKARLALSMVKAGTPPKLAAAEVGISYQHGLAVYMKAVRAQIPVVQYPDGRRRMPLQVRQRIVALAAEGLGPKAVCEQINAETGLDVQYATVKRLILRARA